MKNLLISIILFCFANNSFSQTIKIFTSIDVQPFLQNTNLKTAVIIDGRSQTMFDAEHFENAICIERLAKN